MLQNKSCTDILGVQRKNLINFDPQTFHSASSSGKRVFFLFLQYLVYE